MVTFLKDLPFARYACEAAHRFTSGFSDYLIVVPNPDVEEFEKMAMPFGFRVRGFDERPGKGMCHHMAIICEADKWLPNADAICHIDADCIFWEPCTPADFFVDGKPILYRERFEDFRESHPVRYGWKAAVMEATGVDPEWECMVRHPNIFLRHTYETVRHLIEAKHNRSWREYILSCENSFPQTYAEFPTLGAIAIKFFESVYHWVDYKDSKSNYQYERGRDKLKAFWGHCGIDGTCDRHEGRTAREAIEEILK